MSKNISNSERIAQNALPGLTRTVTLEIVIEGNLIRSYKHFTLQQSARRHHRFRLTLASDVLGTVEDHRLQQARNFLGKRITVIFSYRDPEQQSPERFFAGIITKVAFSQQSTSLGDIVLEGYSPTILMDAAPHFQSFGGEKPVSTAFIAQSIIRQSIDASKFDIRIETRNQGYIPYSAQYNETHCNYLARLAEAYGEQFYYDGQILHFGKLPPPEKPIVLMYGIHVSQVQVELNTAYTKTCFLGYNSTKNQTMTGIDRPVRHPGELPAQSYELNESIFRTQSLIPAPVNPNMELDIDDSQESSRGSAAVEVFTVSGNTSLPFLYPGCVADIEMRLPDTDKTAYFTRLMITEADHEVDAIGHYQGSFRAIAEGTGFMPRPDFEVPKAQPQVATVLSNDDPLGQGRIRVRFQWQNNDTSTHFIRMMSPDAGGTGAVQQNRGFVAIPETGDQVMVGFEYNHPDFPFAMGGMFHGINGLGGGTDNRLRSIQTKSGIRVLMDDGSRSLTIEDPSGNTFIMDGQGNTTVTAPRSMKFSAGENIEISTGKNLEVKTGNSMEFMSGSLAAFHMVSGAVFSTPLMEFSVPVHLNIQSGKTSMVSEEETTIQGKTTQVAGIEQLMIHSEEETTVNSKGRTSVLGKDGNSHSNIPRDYHPLEKKIDGRCLVHFRPQPDWNGRGFGFDWVRAADTGMPGDTNYINIVGRIKHGQFIRDPEKYQKLINSFPHYVYTHAFEDQHRFKASYAVPYITLYEGASAHLDIFIENKESPISIELEYDRSKFRITHEPFTTAEGIHEVTMHITCTGTFSWDRLIKVVATFPGTHRNKQSIAGGLKVKANKKTYELPIAFIDVVTDIGNGRKALFHNRDMEELRTIELFRQAYINPVFEESLTLDLSSDVNEYSGIHHGGKTFFNNIYRILWKNAHQMATHRLPAGPILHSEREADEARSLNRLREFLKRRLREEYPNINYRGVKKVFFINQFHSTGDEFPQVTSGVMPPLSWKDLDRDTVIIFRGYTMETIAHELMHCLGLDHPFESTSKFIFEKAKTDNVMDYPKPGIERISTFHWQWDTMYKYIKVMKKRRR